MAKSSKAKELSKQSYFVPVSPLLLFGSLFLLPVIVYFSIVVYSPDALPAFLGHSLREFGKKYVYESRILALVVVALHAVEVLIAVIICKLNNLNAITTLKWAIQTSVFGIFSLRHLLALQFGSKKGEKKKK